MEEGHNMSNKFNKQKIKKWGNNKFVAFSYYKEININEKIEKNGWKFSC